MTRPAGNHFTRRLEAADMVDPVLVGIVVLLVVFVFFVYLMIRRTFTEFREGTRRGRDRD